MLVLMPTIGKNPNHIYVIQKFRDLARSAYPVINMEKPDKPAFETDLSGLVVPTRIELISRV